MKNQEIKIYSSESIYKQGFSAIVMGMVANLKAIKELTWQLFLRDIKSRYKQSLLGWLWIFFMPIMTMGTFLLLNISGVIKIGVIPVPYPIFGLIGFSLWQVFSKGLIILTTSITSAGSLVTQINFPKEALVIFSLGEVIIDFLIRMALVLAVYLIYGLLPSIWFLLLPLYLAPMLLLTIGLGFLTAVLNVIFRDTKSFIDVGMSLFLFLMPIMYTMPEKGFLSYFNRYNPIYFLINTPREIIISGHITSIQEFILSSILAIIIFLVGWFVFFVVQPKLAERI